LARGEEGRKNKPKQLLIGGKKKKKKGPLLFPASAAGEEKMKKPGRKGRRRENFPFVEKGGGKGVQAVPAMEKEVILGRRKKGEDPSPFGR